VASGDAVDDRGFRLMRLELELLCVTTVMVCDLVFLAGGGAGEGAALLLWLLMLVPETESESEAGLFMDKPRGS
jgi:hypothetical protein